ncbi:MAG: hypothetical protein D6681_06270 [Calditrichaeota bacterium]|nr:MAG: hypothetical protein D6681_06270 [Calditrichota bacterium]
MSILNQLLVEPEARIIAFGGGKGRQALIRRFVVEQARRGKRGMIALTGIRKPPPAGALILARDMELLSDLMLRESAEQSFVYLARETEGPLIRGLLPEDLARLTRQLPTDYLVVDLGVHPEAALIDPRRVEEWAEQGRWGQLIYALDISVIDAPVETGVVENPEHFRREFPEAATLTRPVLMEYLTDTSRGMGSLFHQAWPALLFLSGVERAAEENLAITFARELAARGICHVAVGKPELNRCKRLRVS